MIELGKETILTMRQAAERCPTAPSVKAVRNWCTAGVQGVKLESLKLGHFRITSAEALQRFAERLAAIGQGVEPPLERTAAKRQRGALEAMRELERRGVL